VQRREHGQVPDGLEDLVVHQHRCGELLATVHHSMTDGDDSCAGQLRPHLIEGVEDRPEGMFVVRQSEFGHLLAPRSTVCQPARGPTHPLGHA